MNNIKKLVSLGNISSITLVRSAGHRPGLCELLEIDAPVLPYKIMDAKRGWLHAMLSDDALINIYTAIDNPTKKDDKPDYSGTNITPIFDR